MALRPRPLLARQRVVAVFELQWGAIRGGAADHAQAQARSDPDDRVLDAEGPLLVRRAVALPQLDPGPRCRPEVDGIEAERSPIHGELTRGVPGPRLAGAVMAGVDLLLGAVGECLPVGVHTLAGTGADKFRARMGAVRYPPLGVEGGEPEGA